MSRAPLTRTGQSARDHSAPVAQSHRQVVPPTHPQERAADTAAARALGQPTPDHRPQRTSSETALPAPRIVDDVLGHGGQPLDPESRRYFEPRFGRDFSHIRVHHDEGAARSARALSAQAFSSGSHIVFGRNQWRPGSPQGRALLAHELAHQAQQPAGGAASKLIWRKPLDIADFDAGSFDDPTLLGYLKKLRDTGKIEDNRDSDDKARGVVRKWRQGGDDYALEPDLKVLLIKEMQSGFTGDDDERAILNLLEFSARLDIEAMFGKGKLDPDDLDSDFQGPEEDALRAFYDRNFVGGRKAALKGKTAFTPESETKITGDYSHAKMRAVIDERMARIALVARDRQPDVRDQVIDTLVRREVPKLQQQIAALPVEQKTQAGNDLAADRAQKDSQSKTIDTDIEKAKTQIEAETLGRKKAMLQAEVLYIELAMETSFRDVAMGAPDKAADFQKLATPLTADKKKAAKEAITPVTAEELAAEAAGAPPPPPPKFNRGPLPGEKELYDDKIKARIPVMIKEMHDQLAKNRTKKEHDDPKLSRTMDEMQVVANQAKDEVDLVFGKFYKKGDFKAFQGDKRNKSGTLTKKGNLRDVWQVEEDKRKADPGYEKESATFWLFYLIQNDDSIKQINFAHNASPLFNDQSKGLNEEAKLIRKVGDPFLVSDKTALFEIGRAWDAFQQGKDVLIQLFKNPDAAKDRTFLWDMFFTLMHEYLHKLASGPYNKYADKLGGEHSTEGNTLIEGVDSFLTEIAWSNAVTRAGLPEVRSKVEPDAVAAGLPFDPDLLPKIPHRRYSTYEQAARLVAVVGINNLYAAYFQGRVDLIGGP